MLEIINFEMITAETNERLLNVLVISACLSYSKTLWEQFYATYLQNMTRMGFEKQNVKD